MSRFPSIDLDGALVAITGAARGIGLATAQAFSDKGARVALGDLDGDLAEEAAAALGFNASGHALDVADTRVDDEVRGRYLGRVLGGAEKERSER